MRCHSSIETILASLVCNDRDEHIFVLTQSLDLHDFYHAKVAEWGRKLESAVAALTVRASDDRPALPKARTKGTYHAPDPFTVARRKAEEKAEAVKRAAQAHRLWRGAVPIAGTLAETYLRGRAITCPLPDSLRFAPSCWHATAQRFPALVALVDGGEGFAMHRTHLRADGTGKGEVTPPKAMLGAVAGGAVCVAQGAGQLVVAEGIETALSLASGLLRAPATVWAALSTLGIRGLHLPPNAGRLTIATDGDNPGRAAAQSLAERAHALGWRVSLLPAPDGRDWNDVLDGKAVAA